MIETLDSTLSVALVPEKKLKEYSQKRNNILAVIYYGEHLPAPPMSDHLQVAVSLPQIGETPLAEVWTADLPHEVNQSGNISYAANSDIVFGSINFHESKTDGLEQLAFRAYKEILNFLERNEFPVLVRCWNYFPKINSETNGIERYKLFCAGRCDAFAEKYKSMHRHLPAGSAVGSESGPLTINFIATRNHSVKHFENPRQVSAYLYPREYGKRSPSFARATCIDWGENKYLYVAGTASIVGHKSYHKGDPLQQINEIHRNLETLLDHCGFFLDGGAGNGEPKGELTAKTYLRDPELLPLVRETMEERLGGENSSLYLVGDICRKELLLEVEGVWVKNTSALVSGKKVSLPGAS
jgi:chorismate lyase/3-hydroxybenzoate synthase